MGPHSGWQKLSLRETTLVVDLYQRTVVHMVPRWGQVLRVSVYW